MIQIIEYRYTSLNLTIWYRSQLYSFFLENLLLQYATLPIGSLRRELDTFTAEHTSVVETNVRVISTNRQLLRTSWIDC